MGVTPIPSLSPEQHEAATCLWNNNIPALQVIAGAGSGKTTTLAAAAASAIAAGFSPGRIAIITFSKRAAGELSERLGQNRVQVGYCGTMHALAWRLIRQNNPNGLPPKIMKHPLLVKGKLARELFPEYGYIPEHIILGRGFLTVYQQRHLTMEFENALKRLNQVDFDMMIKSAKLGNLGQGLFDVVMVDEFQDTSPDQVEFIRSLNPRKLFVVGDDWQSIYRFRGAEVAVTRDFQAYFPGARRVYLKQNYRSGKAIVHLGNRAIRISREFLRKNLSATRKTLERPVLFFASERDRISEVWQAFLQFVRGSRHGQALAILNAKKVAVLVRTNALRLELEKSKPENFEILTVHKSKGLEFDNVVVFGIAEHNMPHRENDFDEEVRILYVALSRARNFLGFVGWEKAGHRSRFLPFLMRRCRLIYI